MTIPEAVSLIIQAGAFGHRNATYILDMGEPVPIVDLAKRVIELHGLRVNEDIAIEFTGVRPGEKLYEELTLDFEAAHETAHPKVRLINGVGADIALEEMPERLANLVCKAATDRPALKRHIHELIAEIDSESPALDAAKGELPMKLLPAAEPRPIAKITTISSMARQARSLESTSGSNRGGR
jgi:FlaA1/EpsC-like NDP-sugar epimerase